MKKSQSISSGIGYLKNVKCQDAISISEVMDIAEYTGGDSKETVLPTNQYERGMTTLNRKATLGDMLMVKSKVSWFTGLSCRNI